MNLNALRLFNQVAHRGSFSAAATAARISQPAVSKAIAELEASLGLKLFDRSRRPLALTSAGRQLFHHAEAIFNTERDAHIALQALHTPIRRKVHVAASAVIAEHVLPDIIARFIADNPDISIQLTIGNLHAVASALGSQDADIAVIEGLLPGFEHLSVVPWREQELELYAPVSHGMAQADEVRLSDLADEALVLRESGSATLGFVAELLAEAGVTPASYIEAPSTTMMLALAAAGAGIAIAPTIAARAFVDRGQLACVNICREGLKRTTLHAVIETGDLRPEVARFRDMLGDCSFA